MGLADEVLAGNRRALARLATHVENDDEVGRLGLAKLYPHTGRAHVVGMTGPPGAGKSTLINALIGELLARRVTVGVVAVDPSSPVSGGATLGAGSLTDGRHRFAQTSMSGTSNARSASLMDARSPSINAWSAAS